jgi:signal transduction histidine kinase
MSGFMARLVYRPDELMRRVILCRFVMTSALRKYLDAVLLIAILPVALVLGWQVWAGLRADRDRTEEVLVQAASSFAQVTNSELASSIEALTVLAQSEIFQQGRIAAMGRLLRGRPRRDWDSVFLIDANGAVVLDTAPHGSSLAPQVLRELHRQAVAKSAPVVSGVNGSPGIAIATTIRQAGRVHYVLGVVTSDAVWTRLAANAPLPADAKARLYDAQGHAFGGGEEGANGDQEETYEAWATVPLANWRARVSLPAAPIDAARRRTIIAALSTSGASLAIGFVLAAIAARRLARRIEDEAKAKDEQANKLIHDMRNGLNAIGAAADVLASADPASDVAAEARGIITRQARAMSHSLHDAPKPTP